MEFNKWLKRKYPNNFQKIIENFQDLEIEVFLKKYGYKVGILNREMFGVPKDTLCLYNGTKEYSWEEWNGLYDEIINSETWLGSFDFRYYFPDSYNLGQQQLSFKCCVELKENKI